MDRPRGLTTCLTAIAALVASIMSATPARSDDRKDDTDVVIVNWFDHLTFGLPNTIGSAAYAGTRVAITKLKGEKSGARIDKTGKQIVVDIPGAWPHALGPFQVGDPETGGDQEITDQHEAGHGLQSGGLGLFILLPLALSSLNSDHNDRPIEDWASAMLYFGPSRRRNSKAEIEHGYTQDGKRIGARIWLSERSSRLETQGADENDASLAFFYTPNGLYDGTPKGQPAHPVQSIYRYGKLGVRGQQNCGSKNVTLEAELMEQDILAEWRLLSPAFRFIIDSHKEVGSFEIDVKNKKIDATLLSHQGGYGLRVGKRDKLALEGIGRASYGIKGKWRDGDDPGLIPFVGYGYESKLYALDALELYYRYDREVGTDGYELERKKIGITTPKTFRFRSFTGIDGKQGKPTKIYGSVELTDEKEKFEVGNAEQSSHLRMTLVNVGARW